MSVFHFNAMAKLLLLFFLFFFHFMTRPSLCATNETDMQALLAFKAAIDDDPLGSLRSWNETTHFCRWNGVTCGRKHRDRVISLDLESQGLVGSLPPHLGNLSFLRSITLQNNSFDGGIPAEIGRLRRLEYIEFSNNSLSGEIPRNLSQCQNLYYLNLIDNNLTGIIIPEIGFMSKLEALGLSLNRFFPGTVPPFIGNLTSLNRLSLANCGLRGIIPESLIQLQNLRFLALSENNLTGRIPPGFFNISTITRFYVGANQLHGTIPSDIASTLPNIQILDLGTNLFSGPIPVSLTNASTIERINLAQNQFTGPMMADFRNMKNLFWFLMSENNLTGDFSFISSMTNCTNLQYLVASSNRLEGSLPDSIANLSTRLTFLVLPKNKIHGRIPPGIGNLVNLVVLNLRNNFISGPIPSSIGNLAKVQDLYLEDNTFSDELPSSLGNLTLLNRMYLAYNNISGNIPLSFRNFTTLLDFDLSHNKLKGSVPREIVSLSSISISFYLNDNEFIGAIPSEVGLLRNLQYLALSNNWLSGVIPSSLSSCEVLQGLWLEGNSFEGEIPQGLSALRGLQRLDLSRNQLTGSIPGFLSDLPLLYLNLSFNNLEGEVPVLGVFKNGSVISVDGNNDLCGGIPELKLHSCPSSSPRKRKLSGKVLKIMVPLVVIGGVIFLALIVFLYIFLYKRKASLKGSILPKVKGEVMRLSYADLLRATGGFSEANLVGAGRFGSVYRGILEDGETMVAVKVLHLNVEGASKSFFAECNALRGIRHRNLVKILSICASTDPRGQDFKALVYEFKSNGSLEEWLHQNADEERRNLTVVQRLNIAIDIASALEYLHSGTDSIIIHGDVKPSNILLDDDMTAYVGDFGLAKVFSNLSRDFPAPESSSVAVKGTVGYIAPEYGMGDSVSTHGDAYSYGILLLEMFTNIRPTHDAFAGDSNLHNFVGSALPHGTVDVLDPVIVREIETNMDRRKDCMISVLRIGVACSKEFSRDRMTMTDVVVELKRLRSAYLSRN